MPHKCIYTDKMKSSRFGAVFRHTRATQTFMDPCGSWHVYAPCGHLSLLLSIFFPYFFLKDFIIPHIIDNRMIDFPHHHSIIYDFTSPIFSCLLHILLLFVRTSSPWFTCINWVDTMLYSISIWILCSLGQYLSKSWNRLHCSLQAFGLYCQWLPGLTTKSNHYYSYFIQYHTRFTSITLRILPLTLSFPFHATRPFGAQSHDVTVSRRPNSHDSATRAHQLLIECRIQATTCNKHILAVYTIKY